MKGFMVDASASGALAPWEARVVDAVGTVIEFWGFKQNQGRVWALLYLRGDALDAATIQGRLGLSKGAVSMLTRELEQWGVVRRVRPPGESTWRFVAETGLTEMVGRVIRQREAGMVQRIRVDLESARAEAEAAGDVSPEIIARIERMLTLARLVENALELFVRTATFDVRRAFRVLGGGDGGG